MDYVPGSLESSKFEHLREPYYEGLEKIKKLGYSFEDLIHYFPSFCGHLTLARYLCLIECYQRTLGVAGHMAEIGVYKAAGSMLFAKLSQIYEPNSLVQVHGFDWFRGAANLSREDEANIIEGAYHEPKERLEALVEAQRLGNILKLHEMDMSSTDLADFFDRHPHLQFKLVFFDVGVYDVVSNALPLFWERVTPGGIVIFDQYNFDIAPGETRAVREILPDVEVRTFPHGWLPSAYVVK